jgi:hypothetical protein
MYAVGFEFMNQFDVVVYDECCTMLVAKPSYFCSDADDFVLGCIFHAQLHPFDAAFQGEANAVEIGVLFGEM